MADRLLPQRTQILIYLLCGASITHSLAASMFNCQRLPARIDEIRALGFTVTHTRIGHGEHQFSAWCLHTEPRPGMNGC